MDMEFPAKDNEDHKVVFQHMNLVLLMLLLNHFYRKQLMQPIKHHLNIEFLDSKPENSVNDHQIINKQNFRPQIHLDYVNQYLIQQYKLC